MRVNIWGRSGIFIQKQKLGLLSQIFKRWKAGAGAVNDGKNLSRKTGKPLNDDNLGILPKRPSSELLSQRKCSQI